ncbi:tyrosine-type recombinase/integrase [Pseudoalteromonas nigrifaciens]|uniref:tyrosine-type recombinase/integrase n=1 Tax=Pseudoalteromonas nigrifaciens TaxID=28109 RepID=UPI003FD28063
MQNSDLTENSTGLSVHNSLANEKISRYFKDIFTRLPRNTQRAFSNTMKYYMNFCNVNGYVAFSKSINVSSESVKQYVTSMCESQLAYTTVTLRIAMLSKMFAIVEYPNPLKESNYIRDFIRLELRDFDIYNRANQAPALRLEDLQKINSVVVPDNLLDIRDLAIINTMFDGLLRANEVARIQLKDIDFTHNKLLIETSKSDQEGKGSFRYISQTSLTYISDYINEANNTNPNEHSKRINKGIVFRPLSPKGTSLKAYDESINRVSLMPVLNYTTIYRAIKRIAAKAELAIDISGHSMRVGGAVSMTEANLSLQDIKKAGGWSSEVMPARYTEQADVDQGMSSLAKMRGR